MIAILGPCYVWFGDHVLCDVELKAIHQREDASHVAFVDINLFKEHIRAEYLRCGVDGSLQIKIAGTCVHTLTLDKMWKRRSHKSRPRLAAYQSKYSASSPSAPDSNTSMNSSEDIR